MRVRNHSRLWLALCLTCLGTYACTESKNQTAQPNVNASSPTTAQGSLTPSAYKVEWSNPQVPSEMIASRTYNVTATIKNTSDQTWPSKGKDGGPFNLVAISYHWLPPEGKEPIVWDGARTPLPHDIGPGESISIDNIHIVAPKDTGSFRLQLTLLNEGVTWFDAHGGSTIIVPVTVH